MPAWLLIAGSELTLLRRSAFAVTMAAVLPTAFGVLIVWAEADTRRAGVDTAAGLLVVSLLTLTTYVSGTTTLAARRQQFVLKRLRASGASDLTIMTGVLTPTALLTVLQATLLAGIVAIAGGPMPQRPGQVLLALGAGIVVAGILAAVTAAFTPAPELAQLTTSPIGSAFLGGALWAAPIPSDDVGRALLALPGAAVLQLARTDGLDGPALLALILVAAVGTPVAVRAFGWDPRR